MIETAGWPAILQNQVFLWLFSKSTTVIGVNNARRKCTVPLSRYASTDSRTRNEHGSLTHLRAGKKKDREQSDGVADSNTCT